MDVVEIKELLDGSEEEKDKDYCSWVVEMVVLKHLLGE